MPEIYKLFDWQDPVLNYSTEIIGAIEVKDVEIVHTKFCPSIPRVRKLQT